MVRFFISLFLLITLLGCSGGGNNDDNGNDANNNDQGNDTVQVDVDNDGMSLAQGDCNDENDSIYPGATEICSDGIDQDCDGEDLECPPDPDDVDDDQDGVTENQGDCDDTDASIHPGATEICGDTIDQDCNGTDLECPLDPNGIDDDLDGMTENQGDCDDTDASIHPGAAEICGDTIDQDCDQFDTECESDTNEIDDDGDGITENQGDCDDTDISIYPGADEVCEDEIDQDCDGEDQDCDDPVIPVDGDGDGIARVHGDCNDQDNSIFPGAPETCGDGIDQDCNGSDQACPDDVDNDGDGITENQGDCDDTDSTIYPGAEEICEDTIDQDCDLADIECPVDPNDVDDDLDGITENQGDCDDTDSTIYPGADEICEDSIDQDCDGNDEDCPSTADLFVDQNLADCVIAAQATTPNGLLSEITSLSCVNKGISNLSGLENLDLISLDLSINNISSLASMVSQTNLQSLNLAENNISSPHVSYLQGLTQMVELDLSYNPMTNGGGQYLLPMSNLTTLAVNGIVMADFLSVGMDPGDISQIQNLSTLEIENCSVITLDILEDVSSLTTLYAADNCISDWTPVDHVPNVYGQGSQGNLLDCLF
ncbi:MAG: hypothetical protein C0616_11675 [Desulfuromonas sp.]|nr:MAG: hypothetical protein C0616_11675 [Desulfuromonas sp.]